MLKPIKLLAILFAVFLPHFAQADHIRYSNDIVERFAHKDWVAYKDQHGHCRATTEFIIAGSIASLAIFAEDPTHSELFWPYVYSEYIKAGEVKLELDGFPIAYGHFPRSALEKLAQSDELLIRAQLYSNYDRSKAELFEANTKISLAGSSAALRFCGFIK